MSVCLVCLCLVSSRSYTRCLGRFPTIGDDSRAFFYSTRHSKVLRTETKNLGYLLTPQKEERAAVRKPYKQMLAFLFVVVVAVVYPIEVTAAVTSSAAPLSTLFFNGFSFSELETTKTTRILTLTDAFIYSLPPCVNWHLFALFHFFICNDLLDRERPEVPTVSQVVVAPAAEALQRPSHQFFPPTNEVRQHCEATVAVGANSIP